MILKKCFHNRGKVGAGGHVGSWDASGQACMQGPGPCWVTPEAGPELGSVRCSVPLWAQLFLCYYFPATWPFTLWAHLGKTYSLYIQGNFISKIKGKGMGWEGTLALKHWFFQQVFTEHLPWTKHSAFIPQKSSSLLVRSHRHCPGSLAPRELGTQVKARLLQSKWGCTKHQTLIETNKW